MATAKGRKIGRNKVKCAAYRTRKGGDGSKRPIKAGSNQTAPVLDSSHIERVPYRNRSLGPRTSVTISCPDGGTEFVANVPTSWIR